MKEITKEQQIANHFKELTGNKQEGILSMALNWSFSCDKMAISYRAEANIDAHDVFI